MTSQLPGVNEAEKGISPPRGRAAYVSRLIAGLWLSAWCGLLAGLLETATIVFRKWLFDPNHLYDMSHHFVWLVPVTNVAIFVALCLPIHILGAAGVERGRWLSSRALCAITLLPMALVAFPQVYGLAWLVATLGLASWLVPMLERHAVLFRRIVSTTFPVMVGAVLILAALPWVGDRLEQSREHSAALPPAGSPNVLFIVMDTVAAGHLSLHGYDRPTSTTLTELAGNGVCFAAAHATSSWTLPSHASMFTGRWLHELSVGWLTPLDGARPTLAEYLRGKGYATAGFVANTSYCARDSGLGRGFTRYQDFIFPRLTAFKKTVLVSRALAGIKSIVDLVESQFEIAWARPFYQSLERSFELDRKPAAAVNHEFLNWLSGRTQPERPFFVFLNYFEAHYPYQLPSGRYHRFGGAPADNRQLAILERWPDIDKRGLPPPDLSFAVRAYDDCIADLDEQIGWLTDRLGQGGVLDRTWLIIVADHGESFGEHASVFCHGMSLYQTEVHVPLLIIPPGGRAAGKVVTDAVSIRDLPATVVDLTGQADGSPFPGQSLARFWNETAPGAPLQHASTLGALAEVFPNPKALYGHGRSGSPETNSPLGALKNSDWSYISRDGGAREELFHLRDDANEAHDLAADPATRPTLERMRAALSRMTAGPLLPQRFSP